MGFVLQIVMGAGRRLRGWWRKAPHQVLLVLAIVGLGVGSVLVLTPPRVKAISPGSLEKFPLTVPIIIQFSKPVDRSELQPEINPPVEGQWSYHEPTWGNHLFTTLQFTPQEFLSPSTGYSISLKGIKNALSLSGQRDHTFLLTTQGLPEVMATTPVDAATGVLPKDPIKITFTAPNPEVAEYEIYLDPPAPLDIQKQGDGQEYVLTPTQPLLPGTTYRLRVERTLVLRDAVSGEVELQGESASLYDGSFTTIPPLQVSEISPTAGNVLLTTPIVIGFPEPMNEATLSQRFSLEPPVPGDLLFEDGGKKLVYHPTQLLTAGTIYQVRVAAGAETVTGAPLSADVAFGFTTLGAVAVTHAVPATGATGINTKSAVRLTFNQPVDHAAAESKITLEPTFTNERSWDGDTLIIKPTEPLWAATKYTVQVGEGIPSTLGTPPSSAFAQSFTTAQQYVKLSIANDFQDRPLSCEAAALKMALAAKGVRVTETQIMNEVGYDRTPHRKGVWGDPNQAFVGDINGRQNTTGYGVHWAPIARAANTWRSSEAFTGWSVVQLAHEIAQGNAVVVWGTTGPAYRDSWKTPAGKTISAWKGEHTRTVVGFYGSEDAPTKIIVNDPNAGQLIWSREQFERNWVAFGRAGVVVR